MLRPAATRLDQAHQVLAPRITEDLLDEVVGLVPADWLGDSRPRTRAASADARAARAGGDPVMSAAAAAGAEPFEYALIRVVPRVERGEGLTPRDPLLQRHRFLGCQIELDTGRWRALDRGPTWPPCWPR